MQLITQSMHTIKTAFDGTIPMFSIKYNQLLNDKMGLKTTNGVT